MLYGVNGKTGGGEPGLFTLNTTTGVASFIGPILDFDDSGIDASAMAFDAAGELFILRTDLGFAELWRLDPSDASVLEVVPLPGLPTGVPLAGMEFDDTTGILWVLFGFSDFLVKVDPMTGASVSFPMTTETVNSALEVVGPCGEGGTSPVSIVPGLSGPGVVLLVAGLGAALAVRRSRH